MKITLADKVFNKPLLVTPSYLETACKFLRSRIEGTGQTFEYDGKPPQNTRKYYGMLDGRVINSDQPIEDVDKQIAVVPVMGSLFHRASGIDAISSDGRGYNSIKNEINSSLHDDSVGGVAMLFDTPGGDVSGNFDLARWIASIKAQTDKPIWAIVDESAYSAGYSLASSADRIVTSRSGGVGSIGVVMAHASYEKALKKEGVKITYIHGGATKVDGNPYQDLDPKVLADMQADIDYHYGHFVELVADNRGLDQQAIRDTEARTYNSDDALRVGLIDAIMPADDAMSELFEQINANDGPAIRTPTEGKKMTDEKTYSEAELQAEIKKAKAEAKADSKENEVGAEAAQALASMLADDNATIERVRAAAEMGLDAEQASKFMAHMASEAGSAAKATVTVEAREETKAMSSADLLKQITALANRDLDAVNKNASTTDLKEKEAKAETPEETFARLKQKEGGLQ